MLYFDKETVHRGEDSEKKLLVGTTEMVTATASSNYSSVLL